MTGIVALLTDFGMHDVFVGVMKGVIAGIAPDARMIDLTHDVPPGDVRHGACRLWQAFPFMPNGTVFLSVVDPGVGTARRPIAISASGRTYVGPDNGLFSYALLRCSGTLRAVQVAGPETSATFHGRDVFAPAAARLAAGARLDDLGPELTDIVRLPLPLLQPEAARAGATAGIRGEVLCVDRFGNLVTSIGFLRRAGSAVRLEPWVPGRGSLTVTGTGLFARLKNGAQVPFARTYGEVPPGSPLCYIGGDGLLEIGVHGGRAADQFPAGPGSVVDFLAS